MGRRLATAWAGALALIMGGCATGPLLDNPMLIRYDPNVTVENPVYVPLGPMSYGVVFEKTLGVVSDFFEVASSNRYDGSVKTFPRIAPGFERFWKPGDPDFYQRLEATWQTIRHRAEVHIEADRDGGFFISVVVFKELEDLPRPVRATAGASIFRTDNTVERQFEVIDPFVFEGNWIPLGRDPLLEQVILQRIKKCM